MAKLREFKGIDFCGWGGATNFADGSIPHIAEGEEGILIVCGSEEKDGTAIVSVYFGEEAEIWGFKHYVNKECAMCEAKFLVDLLDNEFNKEEWHKFGFEIM